MAQVLKFLWLGWQVYTNSSSPLSLYKAREAEQAHCSLHVTIQPVVYLQVRGRCLQVFVCISMESESNYLQKKKKKTSEVEDPFEIKKNGAYKAFLNSVHKSRMAKWKASGVSKEWNFPIFYASVNSKWNKCIITRCGQHYYLIHNWKISGWFHCFLKQNSESVLQNGICNYQI